jgi:hypothetical protein
LLLKGYTAEDEVDSLVAFKPDAELLNIYSASASESALVSNCANFGFPEIRSSLSADVCA